MARILAADDDPDVLLLVRIALERRGHEVMTAADGQEALDVAAEFAPDLCILDLAMPLLDGLEVTARLRALVERPDVPILVLTAAASDADARRSIGAGADSHMRKPFSPRGLADRVAELLEAGGR